MLHDENLNNLCLWLELTLSLISHAAVLENYIKGSTCRVLSGSSEKRIFKKRDDVWCALYEKYVDIFTKIVSRFIVVQPQQR